MNDRNTIYDHSNLLIAPMPHCTVEPRTVTFDSDQCYFGPGERTLVVEWNKKALKYLAKYSPAATTEIADALSTPIPATYQKMHKLRRAGQCAVVQHPTGNFALATWTLRAAD